MTADTLSPQGGRLTRLGLQSPAVQRRWVIGVLALVTVAGVGLSVATLLTTGTGWDAPREVPWAAQVLAGLPDGLQAAYDATPFPFQFYGTLNYQIVHAFGVPMDPLQHSTFVYLGLLNIATGIAGSAALAYAVSRALASTLAGWMLAALLATTPVWVGQLGLDLKDVPTAAGLSLLSAGLVLAWLERMNRFDKVAAVGFVALGVVELVGTRTGSIILIGIVIVAAWVLSLFRRSVVASSFFGVLLGLAVVWLQSPYARRGMFSWITDAIVASGSIIPNATVRFAGADINSAQVPVTYIPAYLLVQFPVLTTVLILGGVVAVVAGLADRLPSLRRRRLWSLTPIALQGLVLPLALIASHATLYDAARHVLFAVPALLVLAVLPFHVIVQGDIHVRWARITILSVAGAALVAGMFAIVRWFPYEYAFVNPIAGHNHEGRDWELDYWGLTAREGVERLRELGAVQVAVLPSVDPAIPYGAVNLADLNSAAGLTGVYVFKRYDTQLPENCASVFTIVRDGHVLGEGGLCG